MPDESIGQKARAQRAASTPSDIVDHPNLLSAFLAVQAELPKVGKGETATVPTKSGGEYSYKYADLADVVEAGTPVLSRHGLAFSARPRQDGRGGYEMAAFLVHGPSGEEKEMGCLPLHGNTAQTIGSSVTYMRRYLFGTATGLITDKDDDAVQTRQEEPTMSPAEYAARQLAERRAAAWGAWTDAGYPKDPAAFQAAYEQWAAQPFIDADASDFSRFRHAIDSGEAKPL